MVTKRVTPSMNSVPPVQSGDIVEFESGRYYWRLFPQSEITYVGLGDVVFDIQDQDIGGSAGVVHVNDSVYGVILQNIQAANAGGIPYLIDPNNGRGSVGFSIWGTNIQMYDIKTTHTGGSGIWIGASAKNIIADGIDIDDACYCGSNEGISLGGTCEDVEMSNGYLHDFRISFKDPWTPPSGVPKEGIDCKSGVKRAKFHDFRIVGVRTGCYVDGWSNSCEDIEFYRIIAEDCWEHSFRVSAEKGGIVKNIHFHDLISINPKYYDFSVGNTASLVDSVTFENASCNSQYSSMIFIQNTNVRNLIIQGINWNGRPENVRINYPTEGSCGNCVIDRSQYDYQGWDPTNPDPDPDPDPGIKPGMGLPVFLAAGFVVGGLIATRRK